VVDYDRMGAIAKQSGAYLFVDMAHIAGLVAAGVHPSPIPHADFVTTTTHKSLRGPRGGMILCRSEYAKKIDSMVFPGVQGGPLMHVIAAKAVCLGEALRPEFRQYQEQIVKNARALAARLAQHGYRIVSGGTDNHSMLVDMRPAGLDGSQADAALDAAGITVNKNAIPFDSGTPMKPSGIRVGTPAVTTRGMRENDLEQVADFMHEAIASRADPAKLAEIRERVFAFNQAFPMPE
jgi:glycine hydroxymethyltransferase